MDEEEELEVHFGQPIITPDSPQVSPQPDPEDSIQGEADYAVVLALVNNLRDKLAALNLDNANIRAACDALRRQCHSQGVAFGDLSQLVRQSLEGRQSQQAQEEPGRPHPVIRPELIDDGGNLRAEDIGIDMAGRRHLSSWRTSRRTEGGRREQPPQTGDVGTIPTRSRRYGRHTPTTGVVATIPTGTGTSAV